MAQRGRKPTPPAVHDARGTRQPSRDNYEVLEAPSGVIVRPDGLPLEAQVIWDDFADMAVAMGTLKPADAVVFGQWCVMTAAIKATWAGGPPAPASYVQQWRTLGELFGLAGEKSRIVLKITDGGRSPTAESKNPFVRNGRRS